MFACYETCRVVTTVLSTAKLLRECYVRSVYARKSRLLASRTRLYAYIHIVYMYAHFMY